MTSATNSDIREFFSYGGQQWGFQNKFDAEIEYK
jgi:hypothetical protein